MTTQTIENQIEFTRINNDVNGNPRYVCHFLAFIRSGSVERNTLDIHQQYELALKRSRQLGGKKFHNKQYGGGIVFQMYSSQIPEYTSRIIEIANQ